MKKFPSAKKAHELLAQDIQSYPKGFPEWLWAHGKWKVHYYPEVRFNLSSRRSFLQSNNIPRSGSKWSYDYRIGWVMWSCRYQSFVHSERLVLICISSFPVDLFLRSLFSHLTYVSNMFHLIRETGLLLLKSYFRLEIHTLSATFFSLIR